MYDKIRLQVIFAAKDDRDDNASLFSRMASLLTWEIIDCNQSLNLLSLREKAEGEKRVVLQGGGVHNGGVKITFFTFRKEGGNQIFCFSRKHRRAVHIYVF